MGIYLGEAREEALLCRWECFRRSRRVSVAVSLLGELSPPVKPASETFAAMITPAYMK